MGGRAGAEERRDQEGWSSAAGIRHNRPLSVFDLILAQPARRASIATEHPMADTNSRPADNAAAGLKMRAAG